MSDTETLFNLPSSPEAFGVSMPQSNLRRFDFSALDFTMARRAIIEYIKTYWPDDFNDFVASNGLMMMVEIVAAAVAKLALRSDLLANECFIGTATTERAIVNHLALINQRIRRQTPAIVDIEISLDRPSFTDVVISPGIQVQITGSDKKPITYEVYRAPNDWTGDIVIPASKRGVVAWGVEGKFASPTVVTSYGGPDQVFTITEPNMLESPIFVTVTNGDISEEWRVVTDPIEKYGPNDKVVEVLFIDDDAVFRFGNDVTGAAPPSGASIEFRYRVGGGVRGRIGVGTIDVSRQISPLPPSSAAVNVRFRNISPSTGGTDRESAESAKRRAPRDFAMQRSIVTGDDYAQAASSFSHPVFGSVSKSIASIKTGLNANRVEVYVLAEGPDMVPVLPNAGLKLGLETYLNDLNVLTDHVVVLDGKLKPVDIEMSVIIGSDADASVVKQRVEDAISDFFNIDNWDLGKPLYISNFIEAVERVDGVAYVNLFAPSNNILSVSEFVGADENEVGFGELIIEGNRKTSYYYESSGLAVQ